VPEEINVVILRYLVKIRLVGSIRSTCFGSTGKVCRKWFVLDKVEPTDTSREHVFEIRVEQISVVRY